MKGKNMEINYGDVGLILGRKNSGKSILIEHLLTQMNRYIIIDPKSEHLPPEATVTQSPTDMLKKWAAGNTKLVIRHTSEDILQQYLRACAMIENYFLVIDEIHLYSSPKQAIEPLADLARFHASHHNMGLILSSQQAKSIYDPIFQQIDYFMIFSYGRHEDSKMETIPINKYKKLDPSKHKFVFYRDAAGYEPEIVGPVKIPNHLS